MNLDTYIYKIYIFLHFMVTVLKYGVIIYACSKNQFVAHKTTKRIVTALTTVRQPFFAQPHTEVVKFIITYFQVYVNAKKR